MTCHSYFIRLPVSWWVFSRWHS